ncbi:hypothetical protein [Bacillus sp. C1]
MNLASRITPDFLTLDPKLETVKTAKNVAGKPNNEVRDIIEYIIQARNTVTKSIIHNVTVTDVNLAGLEYVSGTIKVDGTTVTDAVG